MSKETNVWNFLIVNFIRIKLIYIHYYDCLVVIWKLKINLYNTEKKRKKVLTLLFSVSSLVSFDISRV